MEKNEVNKDKSLDFAELEKELSTLVAKNLLPLQLAKKLLDKLKEKNIKITKIQLDGLVEKIQSVMRAGPAKPAVNNIVSTNGNIVRDTSAGDAGKDQKPGGPLLPQDKDMKILVDAVEQLKNRLMTLEKNQVPGKKSSSGRIVTTKDMQTLEEELMPQQQDELSPLTELSNDPENIIVLMKWLQHLVDRVGKTYLADVLSYYVDIGWITDDVRLDLLKYSKGITDEGKTKLATGPLTLSTKDHIQSLLFIQKLKGIQVDERFIWRIDREMEKLGKTIDEYHLK